MAKKLKDLKITKVDFVDEGANPDAHIMLYKSKDGEEKDPNKKKKPEDGQSPEGTQESEETEKKTQCKKSLAKRLIEVFTEFIGSSVETQAKTIEVIEKSGATSFKENFNRRQRGKIFDEIWSVCYSLNDSLRSIIADDEIDATESLNQMQESVNDFTDCIKACIASWNLGETTNVIMKSKDLTESQIEVMKAARDRMNEIIEKASDPKGSEAKEPETKAQSKGEEKDMKFDKSKMTPAERAMLEEFEKRYGSEDPEVKTPEEGVAKAAPKAQDPTKQEPEADDIYKGMTPEAKAEIEALRKFRQDTEDKELHEIAKRYEIIGKKEEELFAVLKSLKATSLDAYNQMVDTLDQAKTSVEKSGAFTEVGKSGNGSTLTDVWAMADQRASEIMKSKAGISKNQALQEVFAADPELARKCKEED